MPYYTGDSVPLKFTLTDAQGAVTPSAATVTIAKPLGDIVQAVNATISQNTVSYTVPGSVTTIDGTYRAYFVLTLSYGERTHRIDFQVLLNPG